jgi:hypothetical protein
MKERQVRVVVDEENQGEEFWNAFDQRPEFNKLADALESFGEAYVPMPLAKKFHAVCRTLPGWNSGPEYARHPLLFFGLNSGR